MGCVDTITHTSFPRQKDENYKYPQFRVGSRVKVCYHYNTKDYHYGTVVRDDLEEPFETIIKLDNGRYLRGVECQFSYTDDVEDNCCEWTEYDYKTIRSPHERDWSIPSMRDFKYCPYCSKKIRVKKS